MQNYWGTFWVGSFKISNWFRNSSKKQWFYIFICVNLIYYKCHKINFKRGGLYIGSPDWIKKKKAIINPKNDDDKCFQYATIITLNHKVKKPWSVSDVKPFINDYN